MAFAVCTEAKQFSSGNLPFAVETLFHTFILLKMETFTGGSATYGI